MVEIKYTDPSGAGWSISFADMINQLINKSPIDSEKEFLNIYSFLKKNRRELAKLALSYHQIQNKCDFDDDLIDACLLWKKSWVSLQLPIDLEQGDTENFKLAYDDVPPAEFDKVKHSRFLPWNSEYVENIRIINSKLEEQFKLSNENKPVLFDAPIYQIKKFEIKENKYNIKCCRNSYFSYMNDCELLHYEFARSIWKGFKIKGKVASPDKIRKKYLPLRNSIDLFDFESRCVGLGINTIFIMKRENSLTFFKHKRHSNTMEAMNTEHVVPAGTFQPRKDIPELNDPDFNIYKNILRELGEELLGKKEFQEIKSSTEDIVESPIIKDYHSLFIEGYAKAFFLGMGLDPLTTKVEILTAIVLNVEEYVNRFGEIKFKHNWEGKQYHFPFDEPNINSFINGPYTLPAGAGCAKLAWNSREALLNSVK